MSQKLADEFDTFDGPDPRPKYTVVPPGHQKIGWSKRRLDQWYVMRQSGCLVDLSGPFESREDAEYYRDLHKAT